MGYKENKIRDIKKLHKEIEFKERLLHYKQQKYFLKDLDFKSLKEWELDLFMEIHTLDEYLEEVSQFKRKRENEN